ncbi:MAG: xanthine dehydrogenase family protein subunit M, partial [Caldiserica bacterium]
MEYYKVRSIDEAVELLSELDDYHILAGGTDLVVDMRKGKKMPRNIVDLKGIKELSFIRKEDNFIEIGALTCMNDIADSDVLTSPYYGLKKAADIMGCYEIRNRATIGGNIVNARPSADTVVALYALEAEVVLISKEGRRQVKIEDFIRGVGKVSLRKGEFLERILIPVCDEKSKSVFYRVQRTKGMDLAGINACIFYNNKEMRLNYS